MNSALHTPTKVGAPPRGVRFLAHNRLTRDSSDGWENHPYVTISLSNCLKDESVAPYAFHSLASRVSHPFLQSFSRNAATCWPVKKSSGWRGQHWMWVARVLKRPVDKNNASAFRGAEFKKLAQESNLRV
jgi:hypothetical protein